MGRRAGPHTEAELEKLSAEELDSEIGLCLMRYNMEKSSRMRLGYFRRLIWLEGVRERLHGIEAPSRKYR